MGMTDPAVTAVIVALSTGSYSITLMMVGCTVTGIAYILFIGRSVRE
jgi:hypothetical protein